MPLTRRSSSTDANGLLARSSRMRWASFGPMPGSVCNCSAVAAFRSSGSPGRPPSLTRSGRESGLAERPRAHPRPEALQPGRADAGHGPQVVGCSEPAGGVPDLGDAGRPGSGRRRAVVAVRPGRRGSGRSAGRGAGRAAGRTGRRRGERPAGPRHAEQERGGELGRSRPRRGGAAVGWRPGGGPRWQSGAPGESARVSVARPAGVGNRPPAAHRNARPHSALSSTIRPHRPNGACQQQHGQLTGLRATMTAKHGQPVPPQPQHHARPRGTVSRFWASAAPGSNVRRRVPGRRQVPLGGSPSRKTFRGTAAGSTAGSWATRRMSPDCAVVTLEAAR